MAIAATIAVDLVARTAAFQSAMSGVADKLKSTGESITQTGQQLTGAFTVPLAAATAGIYQAVQAASDLEETQSAVGVVFGSSAADILAFSENAATALGMSQQEALEASRKFGMFAQAAQLSGQETVGFTTELVQLAADMASFNNASPEETITAIGAALRGESEPIRNFNVLLDDATLRSRALEMGLIATTKNALTPQQRVLAAHAEILAQTGKQQGDFARTSEGLANKQRILQASFADVVAELGQAFLPVALQIVTALQDNVLPLIVQFAEYLSSLSPEVIATGVALGALLAAAGPVLIVIGQIVSVVGTLAGALSLPIAAFAALSAALVIMYTRSETFRELVNGLIQSIISLAQTLISGLGQAFAWVVEKMLAVGNAVGGLAARFGIELPTSIRGAVDTAKQIISELRAPSLDLGVTGSNAAAVDALYGPTMQASQTVATALTNSSDAIVAAQDSQRLSMSNLMTTGIDPVTAALIENENKVGLQSEALEKLTLDTATQQAHTIAVHEAQQRLAQQTDELTGVSKIFQDATDISKQRLEGLGGNAMDLASKFTPLGLLMEILGEAFETLKPVIESLMEPFRIIGQVLGKALAAILRAFFPIIKSMAIAFTYVGQIFFKVAELIAKAIGYAVYGIGKAIDAIPFVSAKGVIRAGQALIDTGKGFGQAYEDLGKAREEIKGLELPEEKEEESAAIAKQSADSNAQTAENTKRIADGIEEANKKPPPNIYVNAGAGADGRQIGSDIARQLDDYYGRGVVREERNAGRVDTFNE